MDFQDQGRPLSDKGMDQICETLGIAEPEVWAVLTVETRGFGFLENRRPGSPRQSQKYLRSGRGAQGGPEAVHGQLRHPEQQHKGREGGLSPGCR